MPRGGQGGGGRGGSSRGGSSRGGGARGGARGGGGPMNRGRGGGFGRGGIGGARGGGWSRPEMNSGPINKMVFWRYQGCEQILGPFKIEANELLNIRNKVIHTCKEAKAVIPICQERARFFYMLKTKDYPFAVRNSMKQGDWVRAGKGFNCGICDVFFDAHGDLLSHNERNCHKEILVLFRNLEKLARDWFKVANEPGSIPNEFTQEADLNGLIVDVTKEPSPATITTPLNDKIFKGLDAKSMNEEEFVIATYDNVMDVHWPKPITEFYCRECNYKSFVSAEELQIHKASRDHQEYEFQYNRSWCVSCQFHTGNAANLAAHNTSPRHEMIVKILEDVRVTAGDYWKKIQTQVKRENSMKPLMSDFGPLNVPPGPFQPRSGIDRGMIGQQYPGGAAPFPPSNFGGAQPYGAGFRAGEKRPLMQMHSMHGNRFPPY